MSREAALRAFGEEVREAERQGREEAIAEWTAELASGRPAPAFMEGLTLIQPVRLWPSGRVAPCRIGEAEYFRVLQMMDGGNALVTVEVTRDITEARRIAHKQQRRLWEPTYGVKP